MEEEGTISRNQKIFLESFILYYDYDRDRSEEDSETHERSGARHGEIDEGES